MKVIHSVEYSRRTADGPPATEYELRIGPPTPHPLARKHPLTGRRAIFLGCHAWKIDGMPEEAGRALIDELMAFTTQERFVYRHVWRKHRLRDVGQPLHVPRGDALRYDQVHQNDASDRGAGWTDRLSGNTPGTGPEWQ